MNTSLAQLFADATPVESNGTRPRYVPARLWRMVWQDGQRRSLGPQGQISGRLYKSAIVEAYRGSATGRR
jgi:hypothetical protein